MADQTIQSKYQDMNALRQRLRDIYAVEEQQQPQTVPQDQRKKRIVKKIIYTVVSVVAMILLGIFVPQLLPIVVGALAL